MTFLLKTKSVEQSGWVTEASEFHEYGFLVEHESFGRLAITRASVGPKNTYLSVQPAHLEHCSPTIFLSRGSLRSIKPQMSCHLANMIEAPVAFCLPFTVRSW